MLRASLRKQAGSFTLDVELSADAGTTVVVVGESGAGKTTMLRLLAGLDGEGTSRIAVGDATYAGGTAPATPAWRRDIGYVPQDHALFPHLTARENVAFGLRALGVPRHIRDVRVTAALTVVGAAALEARKPGALSGGQQQRVALARALVLEPALLLLDEPLAALDLSSRRELRRALRTALRARRGVTVYVTHSPVEALMFGDRIAVIEDGRIVQSGTRDELLRQPRTPYVAELMGVNLVADAAVPGGAVYAVDPRRVSLARPGSAPPAAGLVVTGPIDEVVPALPLGDRVRVVVGGERSLTADVSRADFVRLGLRTGDPVTAIVSVEGLTPYA